MKEFKIFNKLDPCAWYIVKIKGNLNVIDRSKLKLTISYGNNETTVWDDSIFDEKILSITNNGFDFKIKFHEISNVEVKTKSITIDYFIADLIKIGLNMIDDSDESLDDNIKNEWSIVELAQNKTN